MPDTPSDYTAQSSGAGPEPVRVSFLTVGTAGRAAGRTDGQELLRAAPACAGRVSPGRGGPNSLC